MLKVYFVRHAQPEHDWEDDRTRPLTKDGKQDSQVVKSFFEDKKIDKFYCSPYKRSIDTIIETANINNMKIITDERFKERIKGADGNNQGMFKKRWENHHFHEEGGESIAMVRERNIAALKDIIRENNGEDASVVIGTHGTALSSILNYYDKAFGVESFMRIIDWMPYIIELDFEGENLVYKKEHIYIEKEFKGKERADKKQNESLIGKMVTVTVDRPLGSYHPKHKDLYYPINYGFVEGIMALDGEEQDAYILGIDIPVETFLGKIIAVVNRNDDVEDKWVVCPENISYSEDEIRKQIHFQEQYFDSKIRMV